LSSESWDKKRVILQHNYRMILKKAVSKDSGLMKTVAIVEQFAVDFFDRQRKSA
jgi:hypothetical protein